MVGTRKRNESLSGYKILTERTRHVTSICAFDILYEQPRRVVFALWLNNKLFLDGLLDVVLDRSVNIFNDCDRKVLFARQRYNEK